jgi:hypothetical protein
MWSCYALDLPPFLCQRSIFALTDVHLGKDVTEASVFYVQ